MDRRYKAAGGVNLIHKKFEVIISYRGDINGIL